MTRRALVALLAALWPLGSRAQIDFDPNPSASCATPLAMTEKDMVQMAFLHALIGWAAREEPVLVAWVAVDPAYPYLVPAKHLIRLAGVEFRVRHAEGPLPGGDVFRLLANCGQAM